MNMKRFVGLAALVMVLVGFTSAYADLIGLLPELTYPDVLIDNTGTITYNASFGTFTFTAEDEKIAMSPVGPTYYMSGPGFQTSFTLTATVDSSGNLVGTGTMTEIVTLGSVTVDSKTYGAGTTLLSATVSDLGFSAGAEKGKFDFLLTDLSGALVTDGLWPSAYPSGIFARAVRLNGWNGTFTSNFSLSKVITDKAPLACTGSIGDFGWHDQNGNGLQDATEPGLNGVTVHLTGTDVNGTNIDRTTTTVTNPTASKNGFYQFINLCAGTYEVTVDTPEGFAPTTPGSSGSSTPNDSNPNGDTVTLNFDDSNQTIDFGFTALCEGSIGDFVWHDRNGDGIQDSTEPGLNGVMVHLTGTDINGVLIDQTTTTMTSPTSSSNGFYQFTGLCVGDYTVTVDTPEGFAPTTSEAAGSIPDNDSNPNGTLVQMEYDTVERTIDFGFTALCEGSIGDFVWHDQDGDGIQDSTESGLNGVMVRITGTDINGTPIDQTTSTVTNPITSRNGYYQFTGLCAGDYTVTATTPQGFSPTGSRVGGSTPANDSNGSPTTVQLDFDESDQTIDFGFTAVCEGSIGDFVWNDQNGNGIQDASEPGINGVMVHLIGTDINGALINQTTTSVTNPTTGRLGYYRFTGLCAGDYTVTVVTPSGFTPTTSMAAGSTPLNDSNGSPTSLHLDFDESDLSIDFGFVGTQGGQGCTPGYWKQSQHFGSWTAPYTPTTLFSAVFENAFPGKTLLQVLQTGGGGLEALGRHMVAALLNAASAGVSYDFSVADVINRFNAVFPGSKNDYERVKNIFAGFNEQSCPLGLNP